MSTLLRILKYIIQFFSKWIPKSIWLVKNILQIAYFGIIFLVVYGLYKYGFFELLIDILEKISNLL